MRKETFLAQKLLVLLVLVFGQVRTKSPLFHNVWILAPISYIVRKIYSQPVWTGGMITDTNSFNLNMAFDFVLT